MLFDKRYSTMKKTDFQSSATNFLICGTRNRPIRHIITNYQAVPEGKRLIIILYWIDTDAYEAVGLVCG